jgi:hypothetical protein
MDLDLMSAPSFEDASVFIGLFKLTMSLHWPSLLELSGYTVELSITKLGTLSRNSEFGIRHSIKLKELYVMTKSEF